MEAFDPNVLCQQWDAEVSLVIRPFSFDTHGDLGIPHDLRNLHVPLCFLLSLKLKICWKTWLSCASPSTKQKLGDHMRSQDKKK